IVKATELYGLAGTLSGLVAVGAVYFLMSALVKWQGMKVIQRLFPPVVIGPVIMLIGLSLSGTGVNMAAENWLLAIIALVTAIIVSMFAKGLLKLIPIFSGIIVGYIAAVFMGKIDFTPVIEAPWFSLPQFVTPKFSWQAILFMAPVAIAPVIEHVGDVYAVSQVAGKDFVKKPG
ncbi:MAG TPA: uracil permease, partial [Porphyromonadaceae bacterium]|nr:uracil permease [Porphyromonadaceae bacterium]